MEPKVVHSTFVVERSFPKPPQTVFAAFSDPARMRRWYGEGDGHNVEEFTSDFRVGGVQTLRYRLKEGTPVAGMTINNEARFQEIQPDQRIVTVSTMDLSGKRIVASQVTIEFLPNGDGTDLVLTHQGAFFQSGLTSQMLDAGWRALMEKLAQELER